MNIITQRLMIRPFEFGDWQDLQRIALDNLPSVKLLKRLGFEQVSEEEICFYEGHPFRGGSFVRPVNNPTKKST